MSDTTNADDRPPRARATAFIAITVALDALAIGLVIPVLPKLIRSLGSGDPARTALVFGAFATVFGVMQFFAAPIQGALSDRFGRRPIVLASNLGLGLDYLIMALAPNLGWLFAGRLLSGIASGSGAAAFAYLADTTPPERRARSFGLLFAVQAIGAALGPALGGVLSGLDLRAPMWVAAALSLANLGFGVFVLPESLREPRRTRLGWAELNPVGAVIWLARAHPPLIAMIAAAFLLSLASQGVNNVAVLYAHARYGWEPARIGWLLTVYGVGGIAVQGGLVSPVSGRLGERKTMITGLLLTVAGLIVFGLARTGFQFCLAVPLLALGAISGPMMASIFSNAIGSDEQGRLQGAWSGVNSAMGLVAPLLFTAIFAASLSHPGVAPPGAAFFIAAAMVALAAFLTVKVAKDG